MKAIIHSKGVDRSTKKEDGNVVPINTKVKMKIRATPSNTRTFECPFQVSGADLPTPNTSISTKTTV